MSIPSWSIFYTAPMKNIVAHVVNFIFPNKISQCGLTINTLLTQERYCFEELYPKIYSICRYKNTLIRNLIHQVKFKGDETTAEIIASCIARHIDTILESLLRNHPPDHRYKVILIPIPSSHRRRMSRGWNQCEIIARHIPSWSVYRPLVALHILKRSETTSFQKKLSRHERLQAQKNSFTAFPHHSTDETIVIVIDDIVTTGATLREAITTLEKGGYRNVFGIAFAH